MPETGATAVALAFLVIYSFLWVVRFLLDRALGGKV